MRPFWGLYGSLSVLGGTLGSRRGCARHNIANIRLRAVASRRGNPVHAQMHARGLMEIDMYIGGGILGTILIIALIIFLLRRA